jgi:ATP-dependent exoDNAse (exonuclease V) beta subunit
VRFTEQQLTAIERRDSSILVSAGAGTGKTSVLVERFVRAVCDDGVDVASILAITFTEKASAQLKQRVRARFVELNEVGHAREAEAAWISTIHGFCARVLRTHALAAGIDPEFRVLDAVEAERLALDAFDGALAEFLERGESAERLRMIAAYNPRRLADMVRTAYDHLRSQGKEPTLPVIDPPGPAGEHEALRAAATAAVSELGAPEQTTVLAALDKVERCAALLDRLPADALAGHGEVKGLGSKGAAKALQGPAYAAYLEAHAAYAGLCLRHAEYLDHVLLRELIQLHGTRYARLKRDRSGLDFDDLELLARDLLRDDEGLRLHYAERFSHVLVDEFQDTNPLQNEIVELLERENLFRVGDERQSIYRFRHADVKVFREHHEKAAQDGRAEAIGVNFRSRGEVLDAIDLTFSELWGEEFDPLIEAPGAREQPPRADPCVELLVTDKGKKRWDEALDPADDPFGPGMRGVTPWRAAEARLLARRVDELTGEGPYELSDVVLLLRATTHMHIYERALEERGIPTYVLGGRGYWSQQQVGDLRNYLAALANPLDGLALYSVLASPLGGLSLDSLVLIAAEARSRGQDPWRTLTDAEAELGLEPEQAERAARFAERFAKERVLAPRISLETLIDRAVTTSGYDREVLALPAGDRRMANVRKLMRMAREYEAEEGRDLRGFIDFVAERDLVQEREGQAPLEAEDLDAVRLMTIHRAKGLEFPVVCVADLGKDGREDFSALRVTDDGRVGIRLASLGGGSVDGSQLGEIRKEQKAEDEEEERRIFYVAATRAQEHLLLSGATDLEKREPPAPLQEPMRWIWPVLAPDLATGESEVAYAGRPLRVRCEVLRPESVDELLSEADRDPARPEPEPPGLGALTAPALAAVPIPAALPVSRLSYSGLEDYNRCGYRFYLDRALRLPRPSDAPAPAPGEGRDALPGTVRGSVVHTLLERLDFAAPGAPEHGQVAELIESHGEPVRDVEVADLTGMVERFAASGMRERIAGAGRVRVELPFAFTLDAHGRSLLVNGVVDVHAEEDGGVLVVDYKSNRLEGRTPAEITEADYTTQRLVYALAALRSGAPAVEVAYVFLEQPDRPVTEIFDSSGAPELERRLLELAAGVTGGRFEPTASPHRELCADCPGREALCSWDTDRTLAPAEPA